MIFRPVISSSLQAYRDNFIGFVFPSILITVFLTLDPKFLMLAPLALGLIVRSAVVALDLVPTSRHWWFNKNVSHCLTIYLLGLLVIITLFTILFLLSSLFGKVIISGGTGHFMILSLAIIITLFMLYRGWPLISAAFLTEGRTFYTNPLNRYMIWPEGPAWIGPGLGMAWRWTRHPEVAATISPIITLLWILATTAVLMAAAVYFNFTMLGLLLIFLACLLVVSPVVVITTAACWITLLYNDELLLVVSATSIPLPNEELQTIQQERQKGRFVQYRFPENFGEILTYVLPPEIARNESDQLLKDISELGSSSSFHDGKYIEVWTDLASRKNDKYPDLITDLQGEVLLACLPEPFSPMAKEFDALLVRWQNRFPLYHIDD